MRPCPAAQPSVFLWEVPMLDTIDLESCYRQKRIPQLEHCRDAGISGPTSVIFHRMPMAIPRVPCRCICLLLPCRLWPSPLMHRIGVYSDYLGFIPRPDSPSYYRPVEVTRLHHSLYATACGFGWHPRLGKTRTLYEPSRYRVGARSTRMLPHEPALCLHTHKGN